MQQKSQFCWKIPKPDYPSNQPIYHYIYHKDTFCDSKIFPLEIVWKIFNQLIIDEITIGLN